MARNNLRKRKKFWQRRIEQEEGTCMGLAKTNRKVRGSPKSGRNWRREYILKKKKKKMILKNLD